MDIKVLLSGKALKIKWEIFGNSGEILVPATLENCCALVLLFLNLLFIWFFTVKSPDSK